MLTAISQTVMPVDLYLLHICFMRKEPKKPFKYDVALSILNLFPFLLLLKPSRQRLFLCVYSTSQISVIIHHHTQLLCQRSNIKTLLAGVRPHGILLVGPHRASLGLRSLSLPATLPTLDPFVLCSTCISIFPSVQANILYVALY